MPILAVVAGLLLFSTSCKKVHTRSYELEHPVLVYPVKESYNIGDTIWFEMSFSDVFNALVIDHNPDGSAKHYEDVQIKNFDFGITSINFSKLADFKLNKIGWDFFTPIYQADAVQTVGEDECYIRYYYNYVNSTYSYKLGIVCKESGCFLYSTNFKNYHGDVGPGRDNEQDITPDYDSEYIETIHFPVNKQANGTYINNYQLFEQYVNPESVSNIDKIKVESFIFVIN